MKKTPETTEKTTAKSKARKAVAIVLDVVLYLFLAFSVFVLVVSAVSHKNNGATDLFGYEMRIVVSGSMEKSENGFDASEYKIKDIKVKSMVFIKRVPDDERKKQEWYASLKVGDVLTFAYVTAVNQDVITHRIREITTTENGFMFTLCGDNVSDSYQYIYTSRLDYKSENDGFNYVIGKVVGQSTVLGYVIYGVSKPIGVALIVILPCLLIMIWQIARIVSVVGEDRKRKAADKERELEELKQKYAELEKQTKPKGDDDEPV